MTATTRPKIGVTVARKGGWWMWQCNRLSIFIAGGKAVRLRPQNKPTLKGLDGLLIGGGDDISTALYDHGIQPAVRVDEERDTIEQTLATEALSKGMPVMGVCRGAQMLNIVCGGTLHQDIYQVYVNAPKLRTILPRKDVTAQKDSRLARLLGRESLKVNALHHQSIDRVGEGLKATVFDKHGMIQGIEGGTTEGADNAFKIGVQWHPEFLFFKKIQRNLFKAFVKAVVEHRKALKNS